MFDSAYFDQIYFDGRRISLKAIGGVLTFAGVVAKTVSKNFSGALTPSAVVTRITSKFPSGTLTLSAVVTKTTGKLTSGALSLAGSIQKNTSKLLSGTLSFVGALTRKFTGAVKRLRIWLFKRPYYDMATEAKTYRDMTSETREVKR